MERYDSIVIGTGPAGLSAAVTLKVRNKSILVFGNTEVSSKIEKAEKVKNYLGLPDISGKELSERYLSHAKEMGVEISKKGILAVYNMGDYFSVATKTNEYIETKSVILATGVNFGKSYPGEENYLGRGVSYCATCDGPLFKGKKVVVIGFSSKEEAEAGYLSEVAGEVIYIPMYKFDETAFDSNIKVVHDIPLEISGGMKVEKLILKTKEIECDGVFILRESVAPAQLVPGLKIDGNHIAVNRQMETSIPGCFACGDVTGLPYQFIKAAGEGNVAALSVVNYLDKIKG